MDFVARLEQQTYVTEYNPNCRMRFLVRLVAPGTGYIDKLPPGETKDALGWGRTLKEAASRAFRRMEALRRKFQKRLYKGHLKD
ncbi:MAG: hypothetical protein NUV90_01685 [Candidatus Parcubacteria bacterium]|nr:hypothetical protein [Candidatus Parcubacteria bacterium]